MSVSTVGALILLLSGFYTVLLLSRVQRGRQKRLESFLSLIRFIENEVSCYMTPLDEIYRRFENKELEECGFLPALREKGMKAALAECSSSLCFSEEEERLLTEFASELGKSYREEQLRFCEYCRRMLESYVSGGREDLPKRLRLCRCLVMTGSALIVLLFL